MLIKLQTRLKALGWLAVTAGLAVVQLQGLAQVINRTDSLNLTFMSYDIRHGHRSDNARGHSWQERRHILRNLMRYHAPDVAALQDCHIEQLDFLKSQCPGYAWVGVGADDGKKKGNISAVFYNTQEVDLTSEGHFWFSETPGSPSRGWDSQYRRNAAWARFKHRRTGAEFYVFSAQFDEKSTKSKEAAAALLVQKIKEIAPNKNVLLGGSLFCTDISTPYATLCGANGANGLLKDAFKTTRTRHQGVAGTLSGLNFTTKDLPREDFILYAGRWSVQAHAILSDSYDGKYPSDHLPVMAEFSFLPLEDTP
jgi:endonuclease/exonuclease/phosphatase family metal-dependent hydrolase